VDGLSGVGLIELFAGRAAGSAGDYGRTLPASTKEKRLAVGQMAQGKESGDFRPTALVD
jgi:hypothetical protein